MLPVLDTQGNLTFGIYILPIFDPSIDWDTLNYFGEKNAWELLETFYIDEDVNLTNKYIIVKLTDDVRSVSIFHHIFPFFRHFSYFFAILAVFRSFRAFLF